MAVAAVTRAASDAGEAVPVGPFTRHAIDGFRRTAAGDAPPRRGQARGLTADECATVLATCLRPRRTGRGLERPKTAERRGLVDGAIVTLLFHGALRRSEVAALCWTDVDLSDGDDVVVTVRRSKSDPTGGHADVRRLVGGCAAAVRSLHAAVSPEPGNSVVGLSVDQINRRFAAACAAAGLEGRRTSHGGRVGLAVELTERGASTHAIQLAGGWKDPAMVVRREYQHPRRSCQQVPALIRPMRPGPRGKAGMAFSGETQAGCVTNVPAAGWLLIGGWYAHQVRASSRDGNNRWTDSATVESRGPRGEHEMSERQVSLQELELKLDSYIHDVENGATVVVSRDGRQVARIIPETDSAEQKRAALKASGTFDWSGRRPKSRRPSVRLRDGGSVSDIIINERR